MGGRSLTEWALAESLERLAMPSDLPSHGLIYHLAVRVSRHKAMKEALRAWLAYSIRPTALFVDDRPVARRLPFRPEIPRSIFQANERPRKYQSGPFSWHGDGFSGGLG